MNYKTSLFLFSFILVGLSIPSVALAHIVVKPSEVGKAAFQTFTVGVPNEKELPTTGLRVVIPAGVKNVTPNVKPNWIIETKKEGEGADAKVTEISWSGGSIPAGQRDEFLFSVQAPAQETTLTWKAYQTYQDGTVVSWDQESEQEHSDSDDDASDKGPVSKTVVVNDLNAVDIGSSNSSTSDGTATMLSLGALVLAAISLGLQFYKRS